MKKSIAGQTEEFLESQPYLLKALDGGFANISEVARKISEEFGRTARKPSHVAIRAAVKRYSESRKKTSIISEASILKLLRESELDMATGISVIVLDNSAYETVKLRLRCALSIVKSRSGVTISLPDEKLPEIEAKIHRHDYFIKNRDLVSITLITPEKIEDTPGVVAFITDRLAENGINLKEFLSSYRDTVLILEKKDSMKAYQLIEKLIS